MSSKLWRNVALAGVAAAGAAVWAVAPRTFNDKRRNFVPSIPEVWYAHRGLHDAGSGLVGYTDIADYGGDNPVSAQADTTERSIAENDDYVSLARRMAVKAGYGSADMTGPDCSRKLAGRVRRRLRGWLWHRTRRAAYARRPSGRGP